MYAEMMKIELETGTKHRNFSAFSGQSVTKNQIKMSKQASEIEKKLQSELDALKSTQKGKNLYITLCYHILKPN